MLRIIQSDSVSVTLIALEGKLLHPWVDEVKGAVAAARSAGLVRLDLAQLSFADEAGIALLRELNAGGVELTGRSAFLRALMAKEPIQSH